MHLMLKGIYLFIQVSIFQFDLIVVAVLLLMYKRYILLNLLSEGKCCIPYTLFHDVLLYVNVVFTVIIPTITLLGPDESY